MLLALTAVSGCSGANTEPELDGPIGGLITAAREAELEDNSRTLEFLADGVVTQDEYRQGFADQIACLGDHGLVIKRQYVNKYDSWRMLFDLDYDQSALDPSADWSLYCGSNHLKFLELAYSLEAENRVDARLLADAKPCLEAIAGPLAGTEQSVTDLAETTGNRGAVSDCLWTSLQELYPEESAVDAE